MIYILIIKFTWFVTKIKERELIMEWAGGKIKDLIKENKISIVKLAKLTGVSRQTVNDWINGQAPKGNHLIAICKIFNINPDLLFSNEYDGSISVPVTRTRRTAKVTRALQKDALNLAKEYDLFFRNDNSAGVFPVIRGQNRTNKTAKKIALEIRALAGFDKKLPPDHEHVFELMEKLGIKIIFRDFPEKIKAYAFYTRIHEHRVVFINNTTNILDLIFPLLHESVHAVRDEFRVNDGFDEEEELFCDMVANHIQFPDEYIKTVYSVIKNIKTTGARINALKEFGRQNCHAIFGLAKQIQSINPDINLKVGGADTNLKKEFFTIGEILFQENDPRDYVHMIMELSPLFTRTLLNQIDGITDRKLGEIIGIDNMLDSRPIKDELLRLKKAVP
jgi:transcriptional regulator with XRE-family HTH domain